MKACLLFTAAFATTTFAAAVPAGRSQSEVWGLFGRAVVVTPDGTCGGTNGYTCKTSASKCCSQFGVWNSSISIDIMIHGLIVV